jgi:hypothetical protein
LGEDEGGSGYPTNRIPVRDFQPDTVQGTSVYIPPRDDNQLRHFWCIAKIYFPTSGIALDAQDVDVLNQVKNYFMTSHPVMLRGGVRFLVWGTADWRRAENDRLAWGRARSVRRWLDNNIGNCDRIEPEHREALGPNENGHETEYGSHCRQYYQADSEGRGVAGTYADGRTAVQLNRFRAAYVLAIFNPYTPSEEIRRPLPDAPPPQTSTHFSLRILQSTGVGLPGTPAGGVSTALEIVDTGTPRNHLRRIYNYIGVGAGWGCAISINGMSDWRAFTTTVPMSVSDFGGAVLHTSWGFSVVRGRSDDTFRLFAPVAFGGDSVLIEIQGSWSDIGLSVGFGADTGWLEALDEGMITWATRVPDDYHEHPSENPLDLI